MKTIKGKKIMVLSKKNIFFCSFLGKEKHKSKAILFVTDRRIKQSLMATSNKLAKTKIKSR